VSDRASLAMGHCICAECGLLGRFAGGGSCPGEVAAGLRTCLQAELLEVGHEGTRVEFASDAKHLPQIVGPAFCFPVKFLFLLLFCVSCERGGLVGVHIIQMG
jgi:hypothetical protein